MKKITFIYICVLIVTLVILLLASKAGDARAGLSVNTSDGYVSEWTYIPATQSENFAHGLSLRPLDVHVWVSLDYPKFEHTVPYSDYNCVSGMCGGIYIFTVNSTIIRVVNTTQTPIYVQVVAK